MDFWRMLKPAGLAVPPPSRLSLDTPPPTPSIQHPSMSIAREPEPRSPTPSDDGQHTFGSPSLYEPHSPHHATGVQSDPKVQGGGSEGGHVSLRKRIAPVLKQCDPTLTLENSGSVARDHLASERTFLAYVRTSLTIASTGVALVQLFTISAATTNKAIEKYSRPLGALIIAIGLSTLLLGMVRFFTIQHALVQGNYPVARISSILLALVLGAIIVVVFGIIIGVRGKS